MHQTPHSNGLHGAFIFPPPVDKQNIGKNNRRNNKLAGTGKRYVAEMENK